MKLLISIAVVLALMSAPVYANDLDLSIIQNADEARADFAMAVQMGLIEPKLIDVEMAYYFAMNVAYANEEADRYKAHSEVLQELYLIASALVNKALGFTTDENDKGI